MKYDYQVQTILTPVSGLIAQHIAPPNHDPRWRIRDSFLLKSTVMRSGSTSGADTPYPSTQESENFTHDLAVLWELVTGDEE